MYASEIPHTCSMAELTEVSLSDITDKKTFIEALFKDCTDITLENVKILLYNSDIKNQSFKDKLRSVGFKKVHQYQGNNEHGKAIVTSYIYDLRKKGGKLYKKLLENYDDLF